MTFVDVRMLFSVLVLSAVAMSLAGCGGKTGLRKDVSSVNGYYVPINICDAVGELDRALSEKDKVAFARDLSGPTHQFFLGLGSDCADFGSDEVRVSITGSTNEGCVTRMRCPASFLRRSGSNFAGSE